MTISELAQDMAQSYPREEPYSRTDLHIVAAKTAMRKEHQIDNGCRRIAEAFWHGEFENLGFTNIVEKCKRIIKESEL